MSARTFVLGLALLGGSAEAQQTSAAPPAIALRVQPDRICADSRSGYPNFDLLVRNGSARPATAVELTARSFDTAGNLLEHRILWQDALSILGPQRVIAAGEEGVIFNPFSFASVGRAARIDYQLRFDDGASAAVSIRPEPCVTRARLMLPLTGRVLVYDSYDFLSHHRRQTFQYTENLRAFGVVDNWYRFGIDLVPIDEAGRMFKGEGARIEDWYGWGLPVRAAGEGVVVAVRDDMPDNALGSEDWPRKRLSEDEMGSDGNYVLIDHGGGEMSCASHLKRGSARVKKGDRVQAGQVIAQIGNSGATPVPHLHYELRTGWGVKGVRSLPPYFHDLDILGLAPSKEALPVETGDVLLPRQDVPKKAR